MSRAKEIVCALGMGDSLVGASHSCDHPAAVAGLPRLTSTHVPYQLDSQTIDNFVRDHLTGHEALYDLDIAALEAAKPDVIVSQALCNVCAVATGEVDDAIRALPGQPALVDLTPHTLDDVFADIETVASALDVGEAGDALVSNLRERRDRVASRTASIVPGDRPGVPELVTLAGGIDLLGDPGAPSHTLDLATVVDSKPDVVFVTCCGLTTERAMQDVEAMRHEKAWKLLPAVCQGCVYVSDGSAYFASPGPRLIDGLEIMAHALHPLVHEQPTRFECEVVKSQYA